MADVKVRKTEKTVVKVEKEIGAGLIRITCSVFSTDKANSTVTTDENGITGMTLELIAGGSENYRVWFPQNRLHWLRILGVAVSETLEELEKILPAE